MDIWEVTARVAVLETYAAYTTASDRGGLADLAACFAADGVLEFGGRLRLTGPQQIQAGLAAALAVDGPSPSFVHHHVALPRFREVAPDRVTVSAYFTVMTDAGVDHWGRYDDVLVPADGRWLFAARRISVAGFSPGSLMRPA